MKESRALRYILRVRGGAEGETLVAGGARPKNRQGRGGLRRMWMIDVMGYDDLMGDDLTTYGWNMSYTL